MLEIGPGKGALTALLLAELPKLTAVEIDDHLAAELQATYGNALTLYHDNVLNIDPRSIAKERNSKLRIVGKYPLQYYQPYSFLGHRFFGSHHRLHPNDAARGSDAAGCKAPYEGIRHSVGLCAVLFNTGVEIHRCAWFILPRAGSNIRIGIVRFRTAVSFQKLSMT